MSGTKGLTIADLQPALLGMESMDLEELKLSHFIKTEDKPELVILNTKMFENSHFRNLVEIRMDNNEIYEINVRKRPFSQLVNLKKLNLSSNFLSLKHIMRISHSSIWKKLTKLRELDLSFQTCISYDATTNLTLDLPSNLSRVYLSHTRSADDGQPVNIIIISSSSKISNFKFTNNFMGTLGSFDVWHPDSTVSFEADLSGNNMISFNGAFDKSIQSGLNVHSLLLYDNKLGQELGEKRAGYLSDFQKLD